MEQITPPLLTKHLSISSEIMQRLKGAQRVLIGTHEHPDGDAVGSMLAVAHALRLLGKEVLGYLPDPAPDYLHFLPGYDTLTIEKPTVARFDTIVLLDYTQLYRTYLEDEVKAHPNTICIDHHYDNKGEAKYSLIIGEAAATAHILYELFSQFEVPLNRDIATCLLTGIFTDTGSFMHDSVTPHILDIASELMNKGARLSHIAHETYQKKDLPGLRIWGRALSRVMVSQRTGAGISVITHRDLAECSATRDDLAGVVNMLNTLPGVAFSLLLTEFEPGKIKGSLRSEPHKGMNVSDLAQKLGGGGHRLASGFEIEGSIVEEDGKWRIVPAVPRTGNR